MKVGVFGSRQGVNRERVENFMRKLWDKQGPETTVVSGGADGTDTYAEETWLALGGEVVSFRPVKFPDWQGIDPQFGIQEWHLGGEDPYITQLMGVHPSWADYSSAANYRDMLIAEYADRGVAFHYNNSRGTAGTVFFFETLGKPVHVMKEEA